MRAFVKDRFEEAGAVREVPDPQPATGEFRVRVRAASVNPFDTVAAAGYLKGMMECRFPYIPGLDLSGTVDRIGSGVAGRAVGDDVFGVASKPFLGAGTFAELVVVGESTIGWKPVSGRPRGDHRGAASDRSCRRIHRRATPTTRTPLRDASWTAQLPTPPEAPTTTRV